LDRGAGGARGRGAVEHAAASERDRRGASGARGTAGERETADGRDARQGLAAETERVETFEIVERDDLAGGVALERQIELLRSDSGAVVGDRERMVERTGHEDLDPPGTRVERVLDDFLERGKRPLDHLARGDARCDLGRE